MRGFWAIVVVLAAAWAQAGDYVVAVSVDGMGSSYVQALLDAGRLPHLQRLLAEGAATLNARNDHDVTVTLPNHVSMVTSRPIQGEAGHGWTSNTDPAKGMTIHSNRGVYVASVFDAVHDHGRRTGVWASKTKFSLLRDSYDADHGAPDGTGVDNGRNKIDTFVYNKSSEALTADFVASMSTQPCHFAFVHFTETDSAGHTSGWGSSAYNEALVMLDGCLGRIVG
jgi:predicted AlkP superfamily pyrophosphatase or phosphodiesterase